MTQTELKTKCIELMNKYGTPQAFVASKCSVTRTTINMWMHDKKYLPNEVAERLENWLNSLN